MSKIAIFAPEMHKPFIEGIQKSAWAVSTELSKIVPEVLVVSQCSYGEPLEPIAGLNIFYYLNSGKIRLIKYLTWIGDGFRVLKFFKKNEIDLVLVFSLDWSFLFSLCWLVFFNKNIRVRVMIFSTRETSGIGGFWIRLFHGRLDHIFTRTLYLKNQLIKMGVEASKITVATVLPNKKIFLENLSTAKDLPVIKTIAYLSNPDTSAGVNIVIELAQRLSDLKIIIALRKFSEREEGAVQNLISSVKKIGIENIEFRRNIDNMVKFYQEVDAVIMPALDENNTMSAPLVLLEAFVSNTPVFLTDLPVFKEFEKQVFLYKDVQELQALIEVNSQGSELLNEKISEAKKYGDNLLDEEGVASLYIN
ncbi:glycosyltransferase [Candidatus Parcubacteria bacterium]|nr:glycosyltransferase [Patescibacteria group bacterium]MBU4309255.1 glycosyltransferase [Patescibacteria group bacterium]MBU4432484.1 glycosyltransferase [Patescibacteria group bacterium]MBU4577616.1 glycosyltransferase [Patescibacteria group bacterium]MCG2697303.1 glycosyltransferase [Candidatus Parcubacteria bacterium]